MHVRGKSLICPYVEKWNVGPVAPCSSALLKLSLSVPDQTERLRLSSRPNPEGRAERQRQASERLNSWTVSRGRKERTDLAVFPWKKWSSWGQQSFCCSLGHSAHLRPLSWSWQNVPSPCRVFSWLIESFNCIRTLPNEKKKKKKEYRKSHFFLMKFLVRKQKISNCLIDFFFVCVII